MNHPEDIEQRRLCRRVDIIHLIDEPVGKTV
jgi:hypothetical protein